MDGHVQICKPLSVYYKNVTECNLHLNSCKKYYYPWILISSSEHSIFAATDPKMYEYIPFPIDIGKRLTMWAATMQIIFGTKSVKENVLRYLVLCALEKECMVPEKSSASCQFDASWYTDYANCHRHDQSAINLILANINNFDEAKYHALEGNIVKIIKFQAQLKNDVCNL